MKKVLLIILALVLFATPAFAESQTASGVTGQVIIDRARYYLNEQTAAFWSDAELLVYLNYGIFDVADMSKCLETTEKETLATGTTVYAISADFIDVKDVIYSGATTVSNTNPRYGLTKMTPGDTGKPSNTRSSGPPLYYYLWENNLYIDPEPSSGVSGYTLTVFLIKRPTAIALTGAIPTPAAYDDALTLFVAHKAFLKDRRFDLAAQFYAAYQNVVAVHLQRREEKPK